MWRSKPQTHISPSRLGGMAGHGVNWQFAVSRRGGFYAAESAEFAAGKCTVTEQDTGLSTKHLLNCLSGSLGPINKQSEKQQFNHGFTQMVTYNKGVRKLAPLHPMGERPETHFHPCPLVSIPGFSNSIAELA